MPAEDPQISVGEAFEVLAGASRRGLTSLWQRTQPLVANGTQLAGDGAVGAYRYLTSDTPVHKFNESLAIRRAAEGGYNNAVEQLEQTHGAAVAQLDALGRLELEVMDHEIRRFVRAFERIKNIEVVDLEANGEPRRIDVPHIELGAIDFGAVDAGKALVAGGGSAAAVGAASWTAVLGLATASTGTAVGSLSGAAATNAALAWFGGGSIASGGLGMGAGAVVLGGIVAAPAILAGGWILDRKAATERERARTAAAEAALQVETMRLEITAADAVRLRAEGLRTVLERLRAVLVGEVAFVEVLVARQADYSAYNVEERSRLMTATNLVKVTKDVMDTPLFDDDGALTPESDDVVEHADRALQWHSAGPARSIPTLRIVDRGGHALMGTSASAPPACRASSRTSAPVAAAMRPSISSVGSRPACSRRVMTDWVVPIRSASCRCVRPALVRRS